MKRLVPTGVCWCGCATEIDLGSFFAPGHDKRAEARIITEVFGSVAHFVAAFGYAPPDANPVSRELHHVANSARVRGSLQRLVDICETTGSAAKDTLATLMEAP